MRAILLIPLFACLFSTSVPLASASTQATAAEALHALFESEWQRGLRESPLSASHMGDRRYDHLLPDLSAEAIEASKLADRQALERLRAIPLDALNDADRIHHQVFGWNLEQQIAAQRFPVETIALNQRGGIQTFDTELEQMRFETVKDYENWIARMRAFGVYADQTIALLRRGAEAGFAPPRVVMQRVSAQFARQTVASAAESGFYAPFKQFPANISAAEQNRLREAGRAAIGEVVLPAYQRLRRFYDEEYLPKIPTSIAASDLPQGKEYYAQLAAYFTTTGLDPEAIHQIGLDEVARIRADMLKIKDEVKFQGELAAFFEHLRSDPKFFYSDPAALLAGYREISKRIDPELVKVFGKMPRMPYGVRAIPDSLAPDTTTAYYQRGAVDGSRAGYYYVNLYKPETRPKWEMMALSLHEAVPGHHFQIALSQEMPEQPMFRRTGYVVAYGEGWALYAERLGYEMGLYDDPYDRFGQLTYDMWRAVRLVVDTGMHAKGWSREQAIDYFKANAPKTEQDIVNEIDRYIAWPGQALGYKIGQLKILELRARAEQALGERFDLRAFHDALLATGAVPLSVLESEIDRWIAQRVAADTTAQP